MPRCYGTSCVKWNSELLPDGPFSLACLRVRFSSLAMAGIMTRTKPTIIELDMDKVEEILRRVEAKELQADDYGAIKALAQSYVHLTELLKDKNTSLSRLRKMLFGAKTEKTAAVLGSSQASDIPLPPGDDTHPKSSSATNAETNPEDNAETNTENESATPGKGHGRNGAGAYTGAEKIEVPLASLQAGDPCPECDEGTVYETNRPGVLVRLVGQAPVGAKVYYLQKLRCNLCGVVFTAKPPEGEEKKYDATAGSMIALLKYGKGMPFYRMEGLQANLGIPMPTSTQWDIVHAQAERIEPAFEELVRQAAQGDVVHNDDTTVKILDLMDERARQEALAEDGADGPAKKGTAERVGMFTTGIVFNARRSQDRVVLQRTPACRRELRGRAGPACRGSAGAHPDVRCVVAESAGQTEDDSWQLPGPRPAAVRGCGERVSRGVPACAGGALRTLSQRRDRPEAESFAAGAIALSPSPERSDHGRTSRLACPAVRRATRGAELRAGRGHLLSAEALGEADAISARGRAPLDNNICERALKKVILHRKNALFYRTCHGAHVGDIFMSLIYTCELCGTNPFDYLSELDRHTAELSANPWGWMPWNYRQTLACTATPSGTAS